MAFSFVKHKVTSAILVFCIFILSFEASAQCAMCRAVLENGDDKSTAEAINNGIVYLMTVPYVLVAIVGFVIYKKFKN